MAIPTTRLHRLLVLDNGKLLAYAGNATIVSQFPFFSQLKKLDVQRKQAGKPGCGKCAGSNRTTADAYQKVKLTIAGLDSAQKSKLKSLLNADQLRVHYYSAADKRRTITLTF